MVGRELVSRFFEDRTRPRTTVRPSVRIRDLDRVLRHVVRMRRRQVPHRQASTSRDVSDQAFPSLSNFYCVLRCACGGRPGNEARPLVGPLLPQSGLTQPLPRCLMREFSEPLHPLSNGENSKPYAGSQA